MKKLLALLLVMTMSASLLIGCGGSDKDTSGDANQENNDSVEEKVVIDTSIYSEKIELVTGKGEKVQVYYDPTVINCITGQDEMGEYCYLGEMINPSVADAESAQAYVDSIISNNDGYLEIGEQKEIPLGDYMVHYFQLNDTELGGFAGETWVIELGSNVILTFSCIGSVEEGGQLDTELAAIKFVVGDVTIESNQNDNNDAEVEGSLKTHEFPACVEGQTGILTYNGDFVQVSNSDTINGADFDVDVKDGKTRYTIGVTLSVNTTGAEEEIQSDKEWMETKAKTFEIAEIKETTINKIPVKYYSCIYSTNGESENKYFNCFIEFPTIEEYYNYTIMLRIDTKKEEALVLSALENLLVDVELLGVKPIGVGEAVIENDEVDENKYYPEYLKTSSGKNVMVYMDTDAGITWEVDSDVPSAIYIYDKNQDVCYFSVSDAATAEECANNVLQWNDYLEIGTKEEIQLAGRTIHKYHFLDKETGEVFISKGVIELASDVVFTFDYNHMKYDESGLEEVLEALRFVVEE